MPNYHLKKQLVFYEYQPPLLDFDFLQQYF